MDTKKIDGKSYARMLLGGAAMLAEHTKELNALNVFPVADGDTGTNMLKTFEGGLAAIKSCDTQSIGELSDSFAKGVLLSARGNSGVILSQIFAGINEGLKSFGEVGATELVNAYRRGVEKSYASVQNPTEGTILTVFRESTEFVASSINEKSSIDDFFKLHIEEARRSLAATKERLPVLAEADVVDSGAAGYFYIAEGMYKALNEDFVSYDLPTSEEKAEINIDLFTRDSKLEFGYCTEFLIRLTSDKVDPDSFDVKRALSALEGLGGESVVAYKQDDILKIHVHTFRPGEIMSAMQAFGEFLTVKVENMSLGHSESQKEKKKKSKKFSVVAVATGDGLSALFTHMGAEQIISGGQTANPSIEDFIEAFKKCEGESIIVLPNNKNIILAAKQAAELYEDARVYVVESKNLMQGYGALSVITPGITDVDTLISSAQRAAAGVTDGEITRAIRDAVIDGKSVKCGEYIAISGGEITAVEKNAEDAAMAMLEAADTDLCEIISLFVGKNVSPDKRVELMERIEDAYPDCEINVYEGGQDIYDYLLALE